MLIHRVYPNARLTEPWHARTFLRWRFRLQILLIHHVYQDTRLAEPWHAIG